MSRVANVNKLSNKQLEKMSKELVIKQEPSRYAFGAKPKLIYLYDKDGDNVYVPYAYSRTLPRKKKTEFPDRSPNFQGQLRPEQKEVRTEALDCLNKTGSVMISCYPGYGKTCMSINIACKMKMKVLVLTHRVVLVNQWRDSITKFCPTAKIQILKTGDVMKDDIDFYIINAINVPKRSRREYDNVGCVIVDEAHLILAEKLSECMRYITPRYLIGLTATPYRTDGLDILLTMYFGDTKIVRKLHREHIVYKVSTGMVPEVKMNKQGKVDWGSVLESQSMNEKRNKLIVDIVRHYKDRVFLILCKRVAQANILIEGLKSVGEDVTSLIGSQQEFKHDSRILIGTSSKVGVGFDHPRLDTLLLAADVEQYFIQFLGRVFRTKDSVPVIFDLVDNYSLLDKHFRTRKGVYMEHGGKIKNLDIEKISRNNK